MDKATPDTAVAVVEGVDGLELGVNDRCLHNCRQVLEVDERDEVFAAGAHVGRCPPSAKRKRLADWPGADECQIVAYATSNGNGRARGLTPPPAT